MLGDQDLGQLALQFEQAQPEEVIRWAADTFWPAVAASASFQTQSLPLLHMISRIKPDLPIIFLDTGYHFPETLAFRDRLVREWNLNLRVMRAGMPRSEFVGQYGNDLYRRDPDLCCYLNKVEPMQRAMAGLGAWISGVRRDQSPARAGIKILEQTAQGAIRVHPLANWTRRDVMRYVQEHDLPGHPLMAQGYPSIGCAPCTRPVRTGDEERAGRWAGQDKVECGLHTLLRSATTSQVVQPVDSARGRTPHETG